MATTDASENHREVDDRMNTRTNIGWVSPIPEDGMKWWWSVEIGRRSGGEDHSLVSVHRSGSCRTRREAETAAEAAVPLVEAAWEALQGRAMTG